MGEVVQVVHPFEPIYDATSKILFLGSFPSVISRKKSFYYANQTNRFWPLMETLFHEEINDKTMFCLKHHIALWDVIQSCTIQGSRDASIQNVVVNDIPTLISKTNIFTIFFTGKKAYSLYQKYVSLDIETFCLPSTSSANAKMKLHDLVEAYQIVLRKLDEES